MAHPLQPSLYSSALPAISHTALPAHTHPPAHPPDSALKAWGQCCRCMWMAARLFQASPLSGSSCELRVKAWQGNEKGRGGGNAWVEAWQ